MSVLHVNGADLYYRLDGAEREDVVVFINSLGCDLHMWDAQVASLQDRFRIVRYDARGHGRSTCSQEPFTLDQLAGDALAIMDHVGISRANVCGLSLGGATALWLAAHRPDRIERAVFANTGAKIGTPEIWNARIAAVRAGDMAVVREGTLERFLSAPFRARCPDVARRIADMLQATSPQGYVGCCEALRDADLRPDIATIALPSLIIASELDVSTPPSLSQELHAAIAGSELVVIPQTAHLSSVESPDAFNDALLKFLGA